MTSLILCLLPSVGVAPLGNKRKVIDVILKSRSYHVTSISPPLSSFKNDAVFSILVFSPTNARPYDVTSVLGDVISV